MTGWGSRIRSDFVPEWCVLGALVLIDAVWAKQIGLSVTITRDDFLLLGLALGAMAGLRLVMVKRGGVMAEYFALTVAAASVVCVLSYVCLASAGPLVDARLRAMDAALGFDWISFYRFVTAHPWLCRVLEFAYHSLLFQGLYFCLLLGLMGRIDRMREMFWLTLGCSLMACAGTLLFPALGPSKLYNIGTTTGFMPAMEQLIAGRDLNFALSGMTGVVSFPSFHTAMALAYVWAFRGTGPIGWSIAALNALMLAAVPYFGGHYLTDMIAGAATMLMALAVVRTAPKLRGLWVPAPRPIEDVA